MSVLKLIKISFAVWIFCVAFSLEAKVVDEKGNPLPEVIQIFKHFSPLLKNSKAIPKGKVEAILNGSDVERISLTDLNKLAQETFKRPLGMERRDIGEFNKKFIPYDSEEVRALFKKLGDIDAVFPSKKTIDYVFLHGGTIKIMRTRIMFFVKAYESGQLNLSKDVKIVFLTGDRALYPEEDKNTLLNAYPYKTRVHWKAPKDFPKNEFEAAKFIWEQLEMPVELRKLPVNFVNAPRPKILHDGLARPHTRDTIATWIYENPKAKPGHCLSVSNNPYIYYQQLVLENVFLKVKRWQYEFSIEGIGAQASPKIEIALLLDNLARVLFLEVEKKTLLPQRTLFGSIKF